MIAWGPMLDPSAPLVNLLGMTRHSSPFGMFIFRPCLLMPARSSAFCVPRRLIQTHPDRAMGYVIVPNTRSSFSRYQWIGGGKPAVPQDSKGVQKGDRQKSVIYISNEPICLKPAWIKGILVVGPEGFEPPTKRL